MFKLFAVSAVVMGLAQTLTRERIFAPLRERLGGKDTWLGYLVSCPYCASHWLASAIVPLTGAYYVQAVPDWGVVSAVLTWFLSVILVTVVAAFMRVGFYFVDESQAFVRKRKGAADKADKLLAKRVDEEGLSPPPH